MLEQVDIYLQQLYSSFSSVVNMTERSEWLGIDIIGLLSFGYRLNLQTEERWRFIPRSFEDIKSRINVYMQFPTISVLGPVITPFTEPEKDKLLKLVYQMMLDRAARDKDAERDFYSFAKGSLDYGPDYFEYGEFMAEAAFFVTAGWFPTTVSFTAYSFISVSCFTLQLNE